MRYLGQYKNLWRLEISYNGDYFLKEDYPIYLSYIFGLIAKSNSNKYYI